MSSSVANFCFFFASWVGVGHLFVAACYGEDEEKRGVSALVRVFVRSLVSSEFVVG